MKQTLALILSLALTGPAFGGRRRVVAVSPAAHDEIRIAFVGVPGSGTDAMIDAGSTARVRSAARRGTKQFTTIRKTFGVRLEASGSGEGVTATLRASLESHDGRSTMRIDGIPMSTIPKVILAHAPLGVVTTHTIEIEVPAEVAEGAFASAIRWDVSTD